MNPRLSGRPLRSRILAASVLAVSLMAPPGVSDAQRGAADTARRYLWQPGMPTTIGEINVFRRFSSDRVAAMSRFYGGALGLDALPDGQPRMIRYPAGVSEIKLFPVEPDAPATANAGEVAGLRLLTLFFADEPALAARFAEHGFVQPEFRTLGDGRRAALARDPDGEWVELVIVPDAPPAELARFEIGIVAADIDASRSFYRDFLGLDESGPARHPLLGLDGYTYRHGTTTINVWQSTAADLRRDTETAGIQYIVWDVAAVNSLAVRRRAPIATPLSPPGTMRTVWLTDPDGVSNYFAEFAGHDNTPPE